MNGNLQKTRNRLLNLWSSHRGQNWFEAKARSVLQSFHIMSFDVSLQPLFSRSPTVASDSPSCCNLPAVLACCKGEASVIMQEVHKTKNMQVAHLYGLTDKQYLPSSESWSTEGLKLWFYIKWLQLSMIPSPKGRCWTNRRGRGCKSKVNHTSSRGFGVLIWLRSECKNKALGKVGHFTFELKPKLKQGQHSWDIN